MDNATKIAHAVAGSLLASALLMSLAACANPQATGGAPATTASTSVSGASGDCKTMQSQLNDLKAKGQGGSQAYNDLLNRYLKSCFDR